MATKYQKSWVEGATAEGLFLAHDLVTEISKATNTQDRYEHWDYIADVKGKRIKVDIKARKRYNRSDKHFMDDHWIELKNVQGKDGWAIPNEATDRFIAFQAKDCWILCAPEDLVKLCEEGEYERRTREGRKDLIVKIPVTDLQNIARLKLHDS